MNTQLNLSDLNSFFLSHCPFVTLNSHHAIHPRCLSIFASLLMVSVTRRQLFGQAGCRPATSGLAVLRHTNLPRLSLSFCPTTAFYLISSLC